MTLQFDRVGIIGATGPTGRALARELTRRGVRVRAISRAMARLAAAFPYDPIEKRGADARDVVQLSAALAGCDLVVDCIGVPGARIDDHGVTARTLAAVLRANGARCVLVSSTWSYMPIVKLPLGEDHPRAGGPPFAAARRASEDALREAGAAIVHLPDFFGPHAHTGTLQLTLADLAAGKAMNWVGNPYAKRDYIFVPDAMAAVADLAEHEAAYGGDWIVPGSGPVSAHDIAEIASGVVARTVRARSVPMPVLRLASLFDRELRGFLHMVPEYEKAVSYDGAKLAGLIGAPRRTPYAEAFATTIAWLRSG